MQTILLLVIIGLLAGMLSGLVGIGGGIIIVPFLVYFLGFSQKDAQGTSLFIILLPVGLLAVRNYYVDGHVNIKYGLIVAATFVVGAYLGSKLVARWNDDVVKKFFAIVMMLVAIKMLFLDKHSNKDKELKQSSATTTLLKD